MELRKLEGAEHLYVYQQTQQISQQTGFVGYVRGDFGKNGAEWWSSWFSFRKDRNTPEFNEGLQKVVDGLRFETGQLADRAHLAALCREQPDSAITSDGRWFGFRMDQGQHAFLMKFCPCAGDYNFYIYGYHRDSLNRHMVLAERGIRFITPEYKELFRIPDGGSIRIDRPDGSHIDRICRYIDDTHVEVGSGSYSDLFHICEFAERMERSGNTVTPLSLTPGGQKPKAAPGMRMEQTMG